LGFKETSSERDSLLLALLPLLAPVGDNESQIRKSYTNPAPVMPLRRLVVGVGLGVGGWGLGFGVEGVGFGFGFWGLGFGV